MTEQRTEGIATLLPQLLPPLLALVSALLFAGISTMWIWALFLGGADVFLAEMQFLILGVFAAVLGFVGLVLSVRSSIASRRATHFSSSHARLASRSLPVAILMGLAAGFFLANDFSSTAVNTYTAAKETVCPEMFEDEDELNECRRNFGSCYRKASEACLVGVVLTPRGGNQHREPNKCDASERHALDEFRANGGDGLLLDEDRIVRVAQMCLYNRLN